MTKKHTKNKKISVLKTEITSSRRIKNQRSGLTRPISPPAPHGWIHLLLIGAVLSGVFRLNILAEVLLGAWLIVRIPVYYRGNPPPWLKNKLLRLGPAGRLGLVLTLWMALSVVTLSFSTFNWLIPKMQAMSFQQSLWMLLALLMGLVVAIRMMPKEPQEVDLSPQAARFWLLVAFVLTAVINLHHASTPVGTYWDDNSCIIYDIRRIKDLVDFRASSFIFDFGHPPPLYEYYVVLLWKLMPGASDLFIMRFASTLCNLGTVWLLYLAGKEIGGRKTGILAAALGAVSKPLLQYCLLSFNIIFIPFSVALSFLFFFRLLKKPDLKHFLQWGAALTLGIYTYSTYRPFIPLIIFAVFLWILFRKGNGGMVKTPGPVVWTTAAVFLVFFFYTNSAFPNDNWIARIIDVSGSFLPCMVLGGLCLLTVMALPKMVGGGKTISGSAGWPDHGFASSFLSPSWLTKSSWRE